jgi:hypothetical protein
MRCTLLMFYNCNSRQIPSWLFPAQMDGTSSSQMQLPAQLIFPEDSEQF